MTKPQKKKSNNTSQKKLAKLESQTENAVRRELTAIRRGIGSQVGKSITSLEAKIAESLCLPGETGTAPYRWASIFSNKGTALASPFQIIAPNFAQSPATYGMIGQYETLLVSTRNPLAAIILYDQNSAAKQSNYLLYANPGGTAAPASAVQYVLDDFADHDIGFTYGVCESAYQAHGPAMFAGRVTHNPKGRFFWFDVGTTLTAVVESDTSGKVTLACDYWGPNGFREDYLSQSNVMVANTPITATIKAANVAAGYYSLRVVNETGSDNVTITLSAMYLKVTSSVFRHLALPSLWDTAGSVQAIRFLAHSFKFTNTSGMISRSGSIVARQASNKENWQSYIQSDSYAYLAGLSDTKTFPADKGMFGFLKTTQPSDLDFMRYLVSNSGNEVVDSSWPIDDCLSFCVSVVKVNDSNGSSFTLTPRFGIEFETTNLWYSTGLSEHPVAVYQRALEAVRDVEQFHENPLHFKEVVSKIGNFLSSAVSGLMKYAPLVQNVASALV